MAVLTTITSGPQSERAKAIKALARVERALKLLDSKSSAEEVLEVAVHTLTGEMGVETKPKAKAKAKKEVE